ncbi:MAG: MltA domain-containing protein, partial [Gluconacetobacter diazotrophicus]|nr:MltA domain-containing protein [Gluconacetobacter diazotrophicus]
GFLTGYYEPVLDGSLVRTPAFSAPILPRPADLVDLPDDAPPPGWPAGLAAAARRPNGNFEAYPDRAALEAWATGPESRPLVWLRDWVEVFLVHVQGSARLRLPDGSMRRLVYAGRNGHPYTSIGRLLVDGGEISWADMSLDRLKSWIRANGQASGERGRELMQRNRSYIFFQLVDATSDESPTGGAGLPLTAGVSIAVDRAVWSYGLPFWITADEPVPGFGPGALSRLFIAQDTGTAIVGPARVDLFVGSGDAAGAAAGLIRHAARVHVLRPRGP